MNRNNFAVFTDHDCSMPRLVHVERQNLRRLSWYKQGLPFVLYVNNRPVLIRGSLPMSLVCDEKTGLSTPTYSRVWDYEKGEYVDASNIERSS